MCWTLHFSGRPFAQPKKACTPHLTLTSHLDLVTRERGEKMKDLLQLGQVNDLTLRPYVKCELSTVKI
jgi:nitrate reductase assembly molybdenum cofactor insertion protein NarJ